jgi:hypothetical protein
VYREHLDHVEIGSPARHELVESLVERADRGGALGLMNIVDREISTYGVSSSSSLDSECSSAGGLSFTLLILRASTVENCIWVSLLNTRVSLE